jgi:hypothetical protein
MILIEVKILIVQDLMINLSIHSRTIKLTQSRKKVLEDWIELIRLGKMVQKDRTGQMGRGMIDLILSEKLRS